MPLTPRARHAAVRHVGEHHGLSERRATGFLGVDRSSVRHERERAADAAARIHPITFAIAATRAAIALPGRARSSTTVK
jgi:hypothetical protein